MSLLNNYQALPPEEEYARKNGAVRRHDEETTERRRVSEERLETHIQEREQCMKAACDHAGAIGLVYRAEDNHYSRIMSEVAEVEEPVIPEPPKLPQAPTPPRIRDASRTSAGRASKWLDVLSWILSIPVGVFVGYGLATLTGLPIQRQPAYLVAGIVVGVAAIMAIKLLFDKLWRYVGRERAMNRNYKALMAFAFVLTAALVFVEAWLGAQALVIYSKRVVFDVADALQMGTALPLAIAISTATLLISAASGFIKGSESLTEQDEEMKEHELQMRAHEQEVKRQQDEYRDSLTRWESDKQGRVLAHQERLARMEAEKQEMDHYRKSPDFQALLKYIGRINTLNLIITEEEEKMKGDRIARGYEKAAIK